MKEQRKSMKEHRESTERAQREQKAHRESMRKQDDEINFNAKAK